MNTKAILKALTIGGMDMSAVHDTNRGEVEIFVNDGNGRADEKKTKKARNLAVKILGWKGGYRTGYGGFVMQETPVSLGDFGDKGSKWHY